jgi:hypothetical protein
VRAWLHSVLAQIALRLLSFYVTKRNVIPAVWLQVQRHRREAQHDDHHLAPLSAGRLQDQQSLHGFTVCLSYFTVTHLRVRVRLMLLWLNCPFAGVFLGVTRRWKATTRTPLTGALYSVL